MHVEGTLARVADAEAAADIEDAPDGAGRIPDRRQQVEQDVHLLQIWADLQQLGTEVRVHAGEAERREGSAMRSAARAASAGGMPNVDPA